MDFGWATHIEQSRNCQPLKLEISHTTLPLRLQVQSNPPGKLTTRLFGPWDLGAYGLTKVGGFEVFEFLGGPENLRLRGLSCRWGRKESVRNSGVSIFLE